MDAQHSMTLHFNDGTKLVFDFPSQSANAAARQLKLADFLSGKHLLVEASGRVLIFPVTSIKYIELPLPEGKAVEKSLNLPKHLIRGARIRA